MSISFGIISGLTYLSDEKISLVLYSYGESVVLSHSLMGTEGVIRL